MNRILTFMIGHTLYPGLGKTSYSWWVLFSQYYISYNNFHICMFSFVYSCSYLFHMSFASSFVILHHLTRYLLTGSHRLDYVTKGTFVEIVCVILTGVFAFPMAIATIFVPLYHVLHDLYNVHTEVVTLMVFGIYALIAWSGTDHRDTEPKQTAKGQFCGCKI